MKLLEGRFYARTQKRKLETPKIILTADETMMSWYRRGIFVGFTTCMPQGILPSWLYFRIFAPPVPRKNGRAVYADCGLRLIEASLLENGFREEEVAVVHPHDLEKMIGDETEIVAIGGHDLLGINPPTSEFVDLARTGPPFNRVKFLELLNKPILRKVKVVVGGKAAWQVADTNIMDKLGIDYVHLGEGEISVPKMFRKILAGEVLPRIVKGEQTPVEKIPNLRGGVIHGLVEISRGCGRGCKFCSPGMQKLRHKPINRILNDVKVILESGCDSPILHSEDVLRYGTYEIRPKKEKVVELFRRVASSNGVKSMGTSHVALATAYHNRNLVKEVSEIFMSLPKQDMIGTQTGIETGSPDLIQRIMHGKALPSPPEKWPEIVDQSLGILNDNNWIPACTLINGLPGERKDDLIKTLELLDKIKGSLSLVIPLNFVAMEGCALSKEETFTAEKMVSEHWMIMGECMEHDAKVAKKLKKMRLEGENPLVAYLFNRLSDYLIKSAEKYAQGMKKGIPPKDYTKISDNYLIPEILNTE